MAKTTFNKQQCPNYQQISTVSNDNNHNQLNAENQNKRHKKGQTDYDGRAMRPNRALQMEQRTLSKRGYKKTKDLIETMQGEVFFATKKVTRYPNTNVVIKRCSKTLHYDGITIQNGKQIEIQENICKEAQIMQILNYSNKTHTPAPNSMIEYIDFFQDDSSYYLVMENGGKSFFQFVIDCHELIETGKMKIVEWRKQCRFMFAQCIQFIKWMHSKGFCNLDISLENLLISHECYFDEKTGKLHNCYVKFIDFGLSEHFPSSNFTCFKYVGKRNYKSPEICKNHVKRVGFDARKADIWALGVLLFAMMTGFPPCNVANEKECIIFEKYVSNGNLYDLLRKKDRLDYVNSQALDLLIHVLNVNERTRFSMRQISQHQWMYKYFVQDNAQYNTPPSHHHYKRNNNAVNNSNNDSDMDSVSRESSSVLSHQTFE